MTRSSRRIPSAWRWSPRGWSGRTSCRSCPASLDELRATVRDRAVTWDVRAEERLPTGAPLPSAFRPADDGAVVPTSAGADRGGTGAGGGRGPARIRPEPEALEEGDVAIVETLDPALGGVVHRLGGLSAAAEHLRRPLGPYARRGIRRRPAPSSRRPAGRPGRRCLRPAGPGDDPATTHARGLDHDRELPGRDRRQPQRCHQAGTRPGDGLARGVRLRNHGVGEARAAYDAARMIDRRYRIVARPV